MPVQIPEAQSASVKRAQVEFHNFASLGDPERAIAVYEEENVRRGALIRKHCQFIGGLSPFLEIGANAGHSSYMLANEFGAEGFALDISADALRHGEVLIDRWKLSRSPIRVAGDAINLPFRDNSIRFIMTYQTLSQFLNLDGVFREVSRVLAPGGVFLFAEEPLLRLLSLRLYRAPYYNLMRPWEKRLYDWGLLGYFVRDVIGAQQEESFGIRQNHSMYLNDWHSVVTRYFSDHCYDVFVPERGPGERLVKQAAIRMDPYRSQWHAARLLGGTLAAVCKKGGDTAPADWSMSRFEDLLQCPDCRLPLSRNSQDTLVCQCGYRAENLGGVYNLLRSSERNELYPGDREDIIDFSLPGHEARLLDGFFQLEGSFGAKYRWMGPRASARLTRLRPEDRRLRIRGHVHEKAFQQGVDVEVRVKANGELVTRQKLERPGIFVVEADLPDADSYRIDMAATPVWRQPPDDRVFTVMVGMIRLVPVR